MSARFGESVREKASRKEPNAEVLVVARELDLYTWSESVAPGIDVACVVVIVVCKSGRGTMKSEAFYTASTSCQANVDEIRSSDPT